MFTNADYIEGTNDIMLSTDIMCADFNHALESILNAVYWCDTYNVSEDFEAMGNFGGMIRLYNVNRNVMYILTDSDIEALTANNPITLEALEASEEVITDFESRY